MLKCVWAMRHWNRLLRDTGFPVPGALREVFVQWPLQAQLSLRQSSCGSSQPGFLVASGIPLCFLWTSKHMYRIGIHPKYKKKISKTIFGSVRFFAKVHYWEWIRLGGFAHHVLDLRFANCRFRPFQGEWEKIFKHVQTNVCVRNYLC